MVSAVHESFPIFQGDEGDTSISSRARTAARREAVVADRADDDHLAGRVLEQPADVVGVQALVATAGGRHDEAVEALVRDRLAQGMTDRAAALDARVDRHAECEPRCSIVSSSDRPRAHWRGSGESRGESSGRCIGTLMRNTGTSVARSARASRSAASSARRESAPPANGNRIRFGEARRVRVRRRTSRT
jgi:hypothetical protein